MNYWLITGISSGLGKALAQLVMERGDFVVGTFRRQSQVEKFNTDHAGKGFAVKMDLSEQESIANASATIKNRFDTIDVLVNNAGYGMAGAIEETSMAETKAVFETNFFGALHLTQLFLPVFRLQRSGHIIQISSHSGFKGFAGFGIYGASKFALEGFSEALAQEVSPLGIHVTIAEPGPFRTRFARDSFVLAEKEIADYEATAGAFKQKIKNVDGKQEGDPLKAAKAIYDIVCRQDPPLRLPLGKIALGTLNAKLEHVQQDIKNFRLVAENAVFD